MADVVLAILAVMITISHIFWLSDRLKQAKKCSHYPLDYANAIITGDTKKSREFDRLWDTPARPITPTPGDSDED